MLRWWRNTKRIGEKNINNFIGYKDGDYKTKPLSIMLPKTNAYIKIMMVSLNEWIFD